MWATGKKASGGFDSRAKTTFPGAGTLTSSTWTKLPFEVIIYDNLNEVDTVTNGRWTATEDGLYKITAVATIGAIGNVAGVCFVVMLYKNGAIQGERSPNGREQTALDNWTPAMQVTTLELTAGDYIEVYGWHNNGSNKAIVGPNNYCTFERIA